MLVMLCTYIHNLHWTITMFSAASPCYVQFTHKAMQRYTCNYGYDIEQQ